MENQSLPAPHSQQTFIFKFLEVLAWIIFLGLCVEAGAILFKVFYTFYFNDSASSNFIKSANLIPLLNHNMVYYFGIIICMLAIAVQKAYMFYIIVNMMTYKKNIFEKPFQVELVKFLKMIMSLAFSIGVLTIVAVAYTEWLVMLEIPMPSVLELGFVGGDIWIFLGVILLFVKQFIKKGMALQAEQDLTI